LYLAHIQTRIRKI